MRITGTALLLVIVGAACGRATPGSIEATGTLEVIEVPVASTVPGRVARRRNDAEPDRAKLNDSLRVEHEVDLARLEAIVAGVDPDSSRSVDAERLLIAGREPTGNDFGGGDLDSRDRPTPGGRSTRVVRMAVGQQDPADPLRHQPRCPHLGDDPIEAPARPAVNARKAVTGINEIDLRVDRVGGSPADLAAPDEMDPLSQLHRTNAMDQPVDCQPAR